MAEQTDLSYVGRTLVVVLCMHRSGSSLVSNLLHRLGMSLGPFELIGASESNKHGHFEAVPFCALNRELQAEIFGFPDEMPLLAEVFDRFCDHQGRWPADAVIPQPAIQRGTDLVRQLVESGPISGFKDPRTILVWPFWNQVLSHFPGLRIVPLFLARSPHEIAMSVFTRSKGILDYRHVLDVTAVHYKRLAAVLDNWDGAHAVVRFDRGMLADDLRQAAAACNLVWSEEVFSQVYDADCRHHEPAPVTHPAEEWFRRLSRLPPMVDAPEGIQRLERDMATRERTLRGCLAERDQQVQQAVRTAEQRRRQYEQSRRVARECRRTERENLAQIMELQRQLALIRGSRVWRWRQRMVSVPPLKWLVRSGQRAAVLASPSGGGAERKGVTCKPGPHHNPLPKGEGTSDQPATIVIPVYNAFPEAVACLRSVVEHTSSQHPILVVDDCSTAGPFREALSEDLLRDPRLRVVRNGENLGFVKTCNWAMRETAPADVVLLNSDTEVTPGWLDKLRAAASDPRVGTVTPLTTCGTICSIPEFLKDNELPPGYSLHEFAALVEEVSVREYPKLPTCVGFCVFIKREVIDRIGAFDEAAFGKGYGEENDFSCRLQAAGYTDILDDATFVYHRGGMSFLTETDELIAEHLKILDRKHPHYLPAVNQFVASNPLAAVHGRIYNAMLRRWDQRAEYTVLHILHNRPLTRKSAGFPGGVEYHVADLIGTIPEAAHWSLYAAGGEYILTAHVPGCEREYRAPVGTMDLSALICREHFDVVHLHHASAFDFRLLADAVLRHGQYLVSAHDFRMLCPTVNMVMPDGCLCAGHECPDVCHFSHPYIEQLRSTTRGVLQNARAVLHFSPSTKREFGRILGDCSPWRLIEHGIQLPCVDRGDDAQTNDLAKPSPHAPLKVAFVGGPGIHKGAELIRQIVKHVRLPSGTPVEWHRIGPFDEELDPAVHQHGRYERNELPALLDAVSPHLVAILSTWHETYCYTFDEALACGIPVVSTPLGAPAERVRQHHCGWIVESLTVDGFLATLQRVVDHWKEYGAVRRRIPTIPLNDAGSIARRYHELYGKYRIEPGTTIGSRLSGIEEQFVRKGPDASVSLQRWTGRALNACLAALDAVKVRRPVAKAARRVLSARVQGKVWELRQLPRVSESGWLNESGLDPKRPTAACSHSERSEESAVR